MNVKKTSGLEALLEALKQSGFDTQGTPFGGSSRTSGGKDKNTVDAEVHDASSKKASSGTGRSGVGKSGASRSGTGRSGSGRSGGIFNHNSDDAHSFDFIADIIKSWGRRNIIIASTILLIVILAAYWWFHPPINIHSTNTWIFVAIFILAPLFLFFRIKSRNYAQGTAKVNTNFKKAKTFKWLSRVPVLVAALGVAGAILSLSIIPGNAERYANILQTSNLDFASDIQEVNYSEIPVIDRDSAILLGNREMGSIPEYVSQFEISSLYSQINYQGQPVRVSPLGYADIFKWLTNREAGIPAYSLVNMTTQNAQIVKLDNSPIHYSQSEPLVRNIDRHVQLAYPFYMFDEKSFEIDEEGHPWWICPVQTRTIGLFGGTTIERVVLCDATTGACQDLAIEDVPEWVDRAYPADLLIQQYNWSGKYKNGWINAFLGQEGVVQTTPGTDGNLGYNYIAKDDDVWVYTGVTSATSDNSIVGFVLINQRTQESHYYSVPGATEDSAMGSAEGQVQNLRYTATFPLLINVANQPTYFMALKDGEGLVKKFAMIDIQHYQNVAVGDTVSDCQKAYLALLATNGVTSADAATSLEASGQIVNMVQAVVESNSHFYVQLQDDKNIYDFALPGLIEIVGYKIGDTISFAYVEGSPTNPVQSILDEDESEGSAADDSADVEAAADVAAQGGSQSDAQGGSQGAAANTQSDTQGAGTSGQSSSQTSQAA